MATLGSLGGGAGGLPGTGENIGSNITVTEPTSTSRIKFDLSIAEKLKLKIEQKFI